VTYHAPSGDLPARDCRCLRGVQPIVSRRPASDQHGGGRNQPRRHTLCSLSLGLSVDGCARPRVGRHRDNVGAWLRRRSWCGSDHSDEFLHACTRHDAIHHISFRSSFRHVTITRTRRRSRSIASTERLIGTKRASGVSSGILVHRDYCAVWLPNAASAFGDNFSTKVAYVLE